MSQIQLKHNTPAPSSALSALGQAAGARKESPAASGNAQSFSQMLSQNSQQMQAKAPTPAPQPTKPAKPPAPPAHSAGGTSSTAQEENKLAARNAANRSAANHHPESPKAPAKPANGHAEAADKHGTKTQAKTDRAGKGDGAGKADQADGADKAARAGADGPEAADATTAADPAAAQQQLMAMLRDTPQDGAPKGKDGGLADTAAEGGALAAGAHLAKGGHHAGGLPGDHQQLQQELHQAGQDLKDGKHEGGKGAEGLEGIGGSGGAHEIALGETKHAGGPHQHNFEAMLAAAQQGDGTSGPTGTEKAHHSAGPSVPMSAPLDSPDFAPELSASVSMLIQDGVHEAQLQLNPTDMGPVSIQIQVNGQQAQVNFTAEQAATRHALEQSLPDLAAALQNQGLTLSGGGVFAQQQSQGGQHQQGRSDGGATGRGGRGGGGDDDGVTAVSRAERRTQPKGLVDVYA